MYYSVLHNCLWTICDFELLVQNALINLRRCRRPLSSKYQPFTEMLLWTGTRKFLNIVMNYQVGQVIFLSMRIMHNENKGTLS